MGRARSSPLDVLILDLLTRQSNCYMSGNLVPQHSAGMKFKMGWENKVFCTMTLPHSAGVSVEFLTMEVCSPEWKTVKIKGHWEGKGTV